MWAFGCCLSQTRRNRLTLIFCFAFCASACILLPTRSLDGDTDCGTTLLDFQRRPAPLSLGHAVRKGQGDVAGRRSEARPDSCPKTRGQGRPRVLLSLSA